VGEREEIEKLRARVAELSAAREELDAIHRSRLWKVANVYWTLRRTIAGALRPSRRFQDMRHLDGWCNVCGEKTSFYFTDPPLFRESLTCGVCRTTSRYRSVARGLLRAIELVAGVRSSSLAGLATTVSPRRLAVYDTQVPFSYRNTAYPHPDLLARAAWIDVSTSRYDRDERPGARLGRRTTNQNLEKLTYPDASFDVVVTSDVLEHVRRDDLALQEIRRVLKNGGVFLFTVPHFRDRPTVERVRVTDPLDPSRDEFLLEPEYHQETNPGAGPALSYRAYGTDLDGRLRALGFDVDYSADPVEELGIRETELFFCRAVSAVPAW